MVKLLVPPGGDNRHGQHDIYLDLTTGELLQGDIGWNNHYPEAHWR